MNCNEEEITLEYTIYDDGIHLSCPCGWTEALGFWPNLSKVQSAVYRHTA